MTFNKYFLQGWNPYLMLITNLPKFFVFQFIQTRKQGLKKKKKKEIIIYQGSKMSKTYSKRNP